MNQNISTARFIAYITIIGILWGLAGYIGS